jgi:hypothetical protein
MATPPINPDVSQEPSAPLTPEQKRQIAAALAKQKAAAKKNKQPKGEQVPGTNTFNVDEPTGYAKGGSVRGGGCEQRGKTKGKMV